MLLFYFTFREADSGEVWYYSTSEQLQELLDVLDSNEMEGPLVRELSELKHEIIRQMDITEKLTNQVKNNRKSYLELQNSSIINLRMEREDKIHEDQNAGIKIECDEKDEPEHTVVSDTEVVQEVTVTSEETTEEQIKSDSSGDQEDNSKYAKNNKNKYTRKGDDGNYHYIIY